jgi:GNAT superfamily N-acetyltransferase
MWELMPIKLNIFNIDKPIEQSTKHIYTWDKNIITKPIKDCNRKLICDFWNNFYNVTDDYKHNYSPSSFDNIFQDDILFFLEDSNQIIGTIIGKVRPFISLKSSFNIVIVDFLCVHPKFRSKGIATKLIQSLAYWFEHNLGLNIHIFHRELSKCPFWTLSNSIYWISEINISKIYNSTFLQKTFKPEKNIFSNFKTNNFLHNYRKTFQTIPESKLNKQSLQTLLNIYSLISSQNWNYKITWTSIEDFISWILKPHRTIINFDSYFAILEDPYIITNKGKLGEIIWTSGAELQQKYENNWFQSIHNSGFFAVIWADSVLNPTPKSLSKSYSGSSYYYLNNFNYIPNSSILLFS